MTRLLPGKVKCLDCCTWFADGFMRSVVASIVKLANHQHSVVAGVVCKVQMEGN
jgi:hypothetical protein